jgi:Fe-Mn family superoxide dismutase
MQAFGSLGAAAIDTHMALYQGYVAQSNAVIEAMAFPDSGGEREDPARPAEALARRLSFELNGVTLHELYFEQYVKAGSAGDGAFERAAGGSFGQIGQWRSSISALAGTRGSGWVITALDEGRGYLHNFWIDIHHLNVPAGLRVIFVLDLWEHAYMADYGAKGRAAYAEAALQAADMACLDARIGAGAH